LVLCWTLNRMKKMKLKTNFQLIKVIWMMI
jgi:hypothetical protein